MPGKLLEANADVGGLELCASGEPPLLEEGSPCSALAAASRQFSREALCSGIQKLRTLNRCSYQGKAQDKDGF